VRGAVGFITDLCTKLWRVDKHLAGVARRVETPELQRLLRRFAELKDLLHVAHIEIGRKEMALRTTARKEPKATRPRKTVKGKATKLAPPPSVADNPGFITDLCTKLWRVDKQLAEVARQIEAPELQRLLRRFAELKDVLHAEHIEWHDYSGQQYDPGLAPRVLTLQPTAGLAEGQESILETVKPTVYRQGKLLAPGEVIVGIPLPAGVRG
jgi:rubrerythrin